METKDKKFLFWHGENYKAKQELTLNRMTARLLDEVIPKIQKLENYVREKNNIIRKDFEKMDAVEATAYGALKLTEVMDSGEFKEYNAMFIDIIAALLDISKANKTIREAVADVLENGYVNTCEETIDFWENQDITTIREILEFFRGSAKITRFQNK